MNWPEVAAICVVMSAVFTAAGFILGAAIDKKLAMFMTDLEKKFVTRDQAELMIARRRAAHGD